MSEMPDSINIDRNDGTIREEGEESSEIHGSDNSPSPSIRDLGAAVDTQSQSSESIDILPKRKDALKKIRALLHKYEHDMNRESDERHQEGQVMENSEPSGKDNVEKQVIYTDVDELKDLLKELENLDTKEYVDDVTALAFEASLGLPEVIDALIEAGARVDKFDEEGYTLLHNACRRGQMSTVKKIIERRPTSINQRAVDWEYTPLHLAVWYEEKGVGETLLNAGADINSQDTDGWTPLMTATIQEYVDMMHVLLCRKDDVKIDMPDNDGRTPLLVAIKSKFFEGVDKLLGAGANCNGGPDGGEKGLHWVMFRFSRPIFDLFMEVENLDIDVQDSEGKTALHYACGSRHHDMNERFTPYEDETSTDEETSTDGEMTGTEKRFDFTEIIEKLLGREADPWMTTKKNKTALHFALKHRRSDCKKLLPMFSIKAEHLAPSDWDEETLIHAEFKNGKSDNHEYILGYLMNILNNAPKELEETLQWAVASHSRHEFAKYLFSEHQEETDNRKSSWSALRWAIYYRRQELLWWLIATSPRNTVMKNQVEAAKTIKQNEEWTAMKRGKPKDGIVKTEKGEKQKLNQQDDKKIWRDIRDILNNPPLAQIYRDTNTLEPPELNLKCGEIPAEFESLIVRFYKERTNSNSIRLSRKIDETIYGTGVTRLMKNETKKLQDILDIGRKGKQLKKLSQKYQTMYNDEKLRFTWVHLPATNMDWMKDLLKRIMIDEKKTAEDFHKVNSFLRDTWFEIPDRESPSRIMRPQFVKRKSTREDQTKAETPNTTNESSKKRQHKGPGNLSDQVQNQKNEPEKEKSDQIPGTENSQDKETKEKQVDIEQEDFIAASAVYMPFLSFSTHFQSPTSQTSDERSDKKDPPQKGFLCVPRCSDFETVSQLLSCTCPLIGSPKKGPSKKDEAIEDPKKRQKLAGLKHAKEKYDKLIDAYKDALIHRSVTLDESYYHFSSKESGDGKESHDEKDSRGDQERRNKEQIVTKLWQWTNDISPDSDDPWPILRVNQLWVWTINDKWLISATSHPIDNTEKTWIDGFVEHLNKQADAGGVQSQPASAEEMMKVMVDYCIGSYERRRQPVESGHEEQSADAEHGNDDNLESKAAGPEHKSLEKQNKGENHLRKHMLSIRQQFSHYINHVGIKETKLFNKFKNLVQTQQTSSSGIINLRDEIFEAHRLFIDVKDIRDELNILKSIAKYQEIVQEKMLGKKHCAELSLPASYVVNDIAEMDKLVERIQSAIQTTLSLQQSEIASLQADEAVSQGKTMMVFTVATILFLPMSFLSSLFALDLEAFQSTPTWAFVVIFMTSLLVFIPFLTYTIYHRDIDRFIKRDMKRGTESKEEGSRDVKTSSIESTRSAAESSSTKGSILNRQPKPRDIESGQV